MNTIKNRILDISKKHNLSHIGSCMTAADIISDIYFDKKKDEPFILSSGHAGLALYCVLEAYHGQDAEELYLKHGTHPNRDLADGIYCSTGSLGLGLSIALGMAISNKDRNVYCLISDGESFEGICYEVANVIHKYKVSNLKIYLNYNGFAAYDSVGQDHINRLKVLFPEMKVIKTNVEDYGLKGLEAHYISADKI
jgi:transketolase